MRKIIIVFFSLMLCNIHTFTMDAPSSTLDILLLKNQLAIIQENEALQKKFFKEEEQLMKETNQTQQIIKLDNLYNAYEQKSPIFLISECYKKSSVALIFNCPFNRDSKIPYRSRFEEQVSNCLNEKITRTANQNKTISYTSFGCGGAFPDLVILTKILSIYPAARMYVHMIDHTHSHYVKAVDILKISREITSDQKPLQFDESFNVPTLLSYICDKFDIKKGSFDEMKSQFTPMCYYTQKKYKQIVNWLKQKFPQAMIQLFVHESANQYFTYLVSNNLPHADVISAADIQDDGSKRLQAIEYYGNLCLETLKYKKDSSNLLLGFAERGIGIISFALNDAIQGDSVKKVPDGKGSFFYVGTSYFNK